jgi:hypothetical protein
MSDNQNELRLKHLDFIQLTLTRLAANSFFIKGWSVTLVAALSVIAEKDTSKDFGWVALVPAFMFWGLDAYYVRQERLFRKLYDTVRTKNDDQVDFSMNTSPVNNQVDPWYLVLVSTTIFFFHAPIVFAVIYAAQFLK